MFIKNLFNMDCPKDIKVYNKIVYCYCRKMKSDSGSEFDGYGHEALDVSNPIPSDIEVSEVDSDDLLSESKMKMFPSISRTTFMHWTLCHS